MPIQTTKKAKTWSHLLHTATINLFLCLCCAFNWTVTIQEKSTVIYKYRKWVCVCARTRQTNCSNKKKMQKENHNDNQQRNEHMILLSSSFFWFLLSSFVSNEKHFNKIETISNNIKIVRTHFNVWFAYIISITKIDSILNHGMG